MSDIKTKARKTAENIWDDRIGPCLRGEHTVNRSGIIWSIATVIEQAYQEGKTDALESVLKDET